MNLLNALHTLLGQHPAVQNQTHGQPLQVHQAAPQQLGNNTQAAQQYAQNPQAAQFRNVDPAQFGYPADMGGLRVGRPVNFGAVPSQALLGAYNVPAQGGQFNPGYTPLQNSGFGPAGNPQIGAFQDQPGQLAAPRYNPQASRYSWNNY